jgi:branched-subunit amino acid transport protein
MLESKLLATIIGSITCYLLKLAGFLTPQKVLNNKKVQSINNFIPIAMLSALVAVQAFTQGQQLTIDPRAAGLVMAIIALMLKRSFITTVLLATTVTAVTRFFFT